MGTPPKKKRVVDVFCIPRHALAGTLSGGQKRRLSAAIALIGGSQVVPKAAEGVELRSLPKGGSTNTAKWTKMVDFARQNGGLGHFLSKILATNINGWSTVQRLGF